MDLTIAVPTLNRSKFIERLLIYYSSLGYSGRISIGDSSEEVHHRRNKELVEQYQGTLDIDYYHFPLSINPFEYIGQNVQTKYWSYCGDDDVLVPNSLKKCVQFLQDNLDYHHAHGLGTIYKLKEINAEYGEIDVIDYYPLAADRSERPLSRLRNLLARYRVMQFSVQNVDVLRERIIPFTSQIKDKRFGHDFMLNTLSLIRGKGMELDCLHLLRQMHDMRIRFPVTWEWLTGEEWLPSYKIVIDLISRDVAEREGMNESVTRKEIERLFWQWISRRVELETRGEAEVNKERVNGIIHRICSKVIRVIEERKKRPEAGSENSYHERVSLDKLLAPESPYHADFKVFYDILLTEKVS